MSSPLDFSRLDSAEEEEEEEQEKKEGQEEEEDATDRPRGAPERTPTARRRPR